ncbi:MAG: hypothetical protein ACLGH0_07435 [Thermoanaerobaculia bacterium]
MKTFAFSLLMLLAATGCRGPQDGITSVPGHGAVAIQVVPNPIVATPVNGNTYDFPFEVVVRETAGRPINVTRVSANVFLPGGLSVFEDSWDANRLRSMGYDPAIPANGERRYRFNPRREVPDDRLFSGVSAELRVDAVDETNTATSARTVVTVRRQ